MRLEKHGVLSIDNDMLWPDAWRMTVTIHDITPNNYNLYAEYYRRGFCAEEVAELSKQQDIISDIMNNYQDYFDVLKSELASIKGYGSEFIQEIGNMWGGSDVSNVGSKNADKSAAAALKPKTEGQGQGQGPQ